MTDKVTLFVKSKTSFTERYQVKRDFARATLLYYSYHNSIKNLEFNTGNDQVIFYDDQLILLLDHNTKLYNMTSEEIIFKINRRIRSYKYVVLLVNEQLHRGGSLICFNSLDFLEGICNSILWNISLKSALRLMDIESKQNYNIKLIDRDNCNYIEFLREFISTEMNDLFPNVLFSIITDYIIGICDNYNNTGIIKCHNYHGN